MKNPKRRFCRKRKSTYKTDTLASIMNLISALINFLVAALLIFRNN